MSFLTRLLAACLLLALPSLPAEAAAPWHLTKVQMVSRTAGWALASTPCGPVVLRTTNGGASWRNVSPQGNWPRLSVQPAGKSYDLLEGTDLSSLNSQTCWVARISSANAAQIVVEQTQDSGIHWAKSIVLNHSGFSVSLTFLDRRQGWLLTSADSVTSSFRKELFQTKDGGRTWIPVTEKLPDNIDPRGMKFRSATVGWLTAGYLSGDVMPFYRTDDGGKHWQLQKIDAPAITSENPGYGNVFPPSFFGPEQREGLLPFLAQDRLPASGLYRTQDGSETWQLFSSFGKVDVNQAIGLQFLSPTLGWMLKDDVTAPVLKLLRTEDSGRHWHVIYPKPRKQ